MCRRVTSRAVRARAVLPIPGISRKVSAVEQKSNAEGDGRREWARARTIAKQTNCAAAQQVRWQADKRDGLRVRCKSFDRTYLTDVRGGRCVWRIYCCDASATRDPHMSYTILLVEPDAAVGVHLTAALEKTGFDVLCVRGFEDAIKLVRENPIALLITAVRLGPYNGLHLIMRARGEQSRLPAIITSPAHDALVEADAASLEVAYLARPGSDPVQLLEMVSRLLGAQMV